MDLLLELMDYERRIVMLHRQCAFKRLGLQALHPDQIILLGSVSELGPVSQTELARHLGVSTAAVAVSLKRMEKCGMVSRTPHPKDQRSNMVSLTPMGAVELRQAGKTVRALFASRLEGFSQEEKEMFVQFMRRSAENLEQCRRQLEAEERKISL